jgi:hypothetical protein
MTHGELATSQEPTDAEAWALYESMVMFAVRHGLRREEPMSGWWWSTKFGEAQLGEIIVELLQEKHKIDTRTKVEAEPMEFWG